MDILDDMGVSKLSAKENYFFNISSSINLQELTVCISKCY